MWVQSLSGEDLLEKEMAAPSNILAWEIPWAEELGGLQSMGVTKSQTGLSDYITTSRIDIQPGGVMTECRKETHGGHSSSRLLSSGVPESGM